MSDFDSRARIERNLVPLRRDAGGVVFGVSVHCISCGKPDGFVPRGLPPGVIYLCGDCEATYGVPVEMTERPDLELERTHG